MAGAAARPGGQQFADGTVPTALRLTESVTYPNGTLQLAYETAGAPTYGNRAIEEQDPLRLAGDDVSRPTTRGFLGGRARRGLGDRTRRGQPESSRPVPVRLFVSLVTG